ncbi:MAG: conjugal transfer protein TraA [Gammaproteobacteria bacterium]|nr:MAG: conjugal transfer protein TraA [Gammaproteobacteria bacterium]
MNRPLVVSKAKNFASLTMAVMVAGGFLLLEANASTTGASATFADILTWLTEVIQGTLGAVVCATMVLVGIIAGIARQSLMAFAIGIGGGVGLYNTPTILGSIFTATLEQAANVNSAVITFSSGF